MDAVWHGLDHVSDSLVLVPLVAYSFTVFGVLLASILLPCDGSVPLLLTSSELKYLPLYLDDTASDSLQQPDVNDVTIDFESLSEDPDEAEPPSRNSSSSSSVASTSSMLSNNSMTTRPSRAICHDARETFPYDET
eukprot:CAMPEP_0185833764 /NCGR_PEP_ID=MMETSP1353-20130828/3424_1 /TAXON_ID=1077150 /ORGANISM="Erythrolobus australicus, Strain CCMP3124" /LENGTH=135 /DNA_ID=CAMNT_0028532091 /DNA_START=103 /DNA_END=510 /DNA_ORIENTATION=+